MTKNKYYFYNTNDGKKIRYIYNKSKSKIVIIFLHGMMSDINGKKVKYIYKLSKKLNINFLAFDLLGHGKSSGNFLDFGISDWYGQSKEIIKSLVKNKKIILIGSSMGGWIGILLLKKLKNIIAFIGIAAAYDFTEKKMWKNFSPKIKKKISNGKVHYLKNSYGGYYPISINLIRNSKKYLLKEKKINLKIPIKLITGQKDKVVSFQDTLDMNMILNSKDKKIFLQKDGDHSLSKIQDLKRIKEIILDILKNII
ncbi:MAG: alpha/beta hydrolase [Candidatus Pelagibacter sp.]|nr:alpha/beta hydrolase [Candidatus Pelagibacter sp.]OUV97995.1 MAG: hypothetical protein CBD02_02200 [Candidatus Pelagibacter sp. TMED142]|tara:strand:- start:1265 stop:2026 length:762 start_codon:yes stop_codon:yes gene_type:complete